MNRRQWIRWNAVAVNFTDERWNVFSYLPLLPPRREDAIYHWWTKKVIIKLFVIETADGTTHVYVYTRAFSQNYVSSKIHFSIISRSGIRASCGIRYMITMRRDTRMTLIMYLYTLGRQWVIVRLVGRFGVQRSLLKILVIVGYQTIRQFQNGVLLAVVGSGAFL